MSLSAWLIGNPEIDKHYHEAEEELQSKVSHCNCWKMITCPVQPKHSRCSSNGTSALSNHVSNGTDGSDSPDEGSGKRDGRVDMSSRHGEEDSGEGGYGKTSNYATVDLGAGIG